jgi:hypothetical protein
MQGRGAVTKAADLFAAVGFPLAEAAATPQSSQPRGRGGKADQGPGISCCVSSIMWPVSALRKVQWMHSRGGAGELPGEMLYTHPARNAKP